MRALALAVFFFPAVAAAQRCAHFDLFPSEGVDLDLVSALRQRMERAGLASTGDLEDCPVRLVLAGEADLDVTVELEDRVVNRSFAREPPREAAWSIALLLEELAGVDSPAPPEEIIPEVQIPVAPPDLRPTPTPTRHVFPTERREVARLGLGVRPLAGIRYGTQNAVVEQGALALDVAAVAPLLPQWLRPVASFAWYVPTPRQRINVQSVQPSVGASLEILRYDRFVLWTDLELVLFRKHWVEGTRYPPPTTWLGASGRVRAEYRLGRAFGIAVGGVATWLPTITALYCDDEVWIDPDHPDEEIHERRCDRSPLDLYTTPWDVGGVLEAMFHL